MNLRTIAAGLFGGVLAIGGSTIVHAVVDDPAEQIALSLTIAGAVVATVLILSLRS